MPLWRSIPTVRGLAISLVVANHAIQASSSVFVRAYPAVSPDATPGAFLTILLLRSLTPVCLAAFFFTSGFMAIRFFTTARAARVAAGQIFRKYLIWSAAMLTLQVLLHRRELDWRDIGRALVLGGAQDAYWFLVVIAVLMVTTPVWVRVVTAGRRSGLWAAAGVQAASCAVFYLLLLRQSPRSTWEIATLRPIQFLPGYLAGMWVSLHADRVAGWVRARRRVLVPLAGAAALATVVEAYALWSATGFRLAGPQAMFATERGTLIAFSFLAVAVLITTDLRSERVATWLKHVGNSSLGIMLLMDVCITVALGAAWWAARSRPALAASLADHALWLTPAVFAAGLWGPLRIMDAVRRVAGNRVRYLW